MIVTLISTCSLLFAIATTSVKTNEKVEILNDFVGNEFNLIEGDNSYSIYDKNGTMIEKSYESNSPYYCYEGNKYYLGPLNYYVENNGVIKDILKDKNVSVKELEGASYEIENSSYEVEESKIMKKQSLNIDSNNTFCDNNGFTVIAKGDYFKRLTYFPQNWYGECGLIALSMLLSYYDTFYNDDFIPNDLQYNARYYDQYYDENNNYHIEYSHSNLEPLIRPGIVECKGLDNYPFEVWDAMPGTNYSMRDFLFDNYMHNYLWIGGENGYPMADGELKSTMKDYMSANCENLLENTEFKSGSLYYTHEEPKKLISDGIPVVLVLFNYKSSYKNGDFHDVVAYGYKNDEFLVHLGYGPNGSTTSNIILNSATIYGYFALKYSGEHKHSYNVSMYDGNVWKYICGCGEINKERHTVSPYQWGFDERYYFENEGIRTKTINFNNELDIYSERLRCGYIENEFINLSANRYNAGDAYLKLEFNKKLFELDLNMCLWGEYEGLSSADGDYAYIQYQDINGEWINSVNLLECNLPTDRKKPKFYKIYFNNGTYIIRIKCHKNNPHTVRNKGRICMGTMNFITEI